MNEGWESPDESPYSENKQQPRNTYQDTEKRNNGRHDQRNPEFDSTWGDVSSFVSERQKPKIFKPRFHNDSTREINVPTNMVGKIIGRGGSKIIELQEKSGARIIVTKKVTDTETVLKLYGDETVQETAEKMIQDLIGEKKCYSESSAGNDNSQKVRPPVMINWKELNEQCDLIKKEKLAKLPLLVKNVYVEAPEVGALSKEEAAELRRKNNDTNVQGSIPVPSPVWTFDQAFHSWPEIMDILNQTGFANPSPVQAQAWPALLQGHDVVAVAQTGTGKTLAFLLPGLVHIAAQPQLPDAPNGPRMLILAPTRELAQQIERETKKFQVFGIRAVCVYGGGNRGDQIRNIEQGVQIIIATPGRLNDLLHAELLDLSAVSYLVLDEADRMLDMGFEPQIRKSLLDVRPDRQSVLTSATWPPGVRRLSESYTSNPLHIRVGTLDLAAVESVTQNILILAGDDDEAIEEEKFRTLINWMQAMEPTDKVIVFCARKARADYLASELAFLSIDCQCLHGGREQEDREAALNELSTGQVRILIATDLASRGLDVHDITHVINYDLPHQLEEYVHRVGRTGRAGRKGVAISYVSRKDWARADDLATLLRSANQYVPEELDAMAKRYKAWYQRRQQ